MSCSSSSSPIPSGCAPACRSAQCAGSRASSSFTTASARSFTPTVFWTPTSSPGCLRSSRFIRLTEGLYQRVVARAAEGALKRLPRLPEWIAEGTLERLNMPGFAVALAAMHRPGAPEDVDPAGPATTRLAYDELLANQLALLLVRARLRETAGRAHVADGTLGARLEAALPFALTGAQKTALVRDPRRPAVRESHYSAPAGRCRLGQDRRCAPRHGRSGRSRPAGRDDGADGSAGAPAFRPDGAARRQGGPQHGADDGPRQGFGAARDAGGAGLRRAQHRDRNARALQDKVVFADLGLAVVDEQHRFGVRQRLALAGKGRRPISW